MKNVKKIHWSYVRRRIERLIFVEDCEGAVRSRTEERATNKSLNYSVDGSDPHPVEVINSLNMQFFIISFEVFSVMNINKTEKQCHVSGTNTKQDE